jgi:hypothetical protein
VQQCTCTTGATSTYCPVHTPSNVTIRWYQNTMGAAGCAGANYTYTVPVTTTAQPWQIPAAAGIAAAAGAAGAHLQTYTAGGECA